MAAWNNFGPENVPEHFSGAGTYTESNNALCLNKGLACKTKYNYTVGHSSILWIMCEVT